MNTPDVVELGSVMSETKKTGQLPDSTAPHLISFEPV